MHTLYLQGISIDELKTLIRGCIDEALQTYHRRNTPAPKKENEEYLSRKEIAELFNISLPTLRKYCLDGQIPSHKLGKKVLFKRSEIEQGLTAIYDLKHKKQSIINPYVLHKTILKGAAQK